MNYDEDVAIRDYRRRDGTWTLIKRIKVIFNIVIHWIIAFFVFSFLHYLKVNLLILAWEHPFWRMVLIGCGIIVIIFLIAGREVMRV